MCGIAGSINHNLDIQRLTKDLFHRGPDEQATCSDNVLQLHHHRLAILDIAGGKQPIHYKHFTVIFNGEIYNHRDLRKKHNLQDCVTNSDTETIVHLYAKLGPSCLNDMDGMFTIAIYDKEKQELFLARDRAGKKPLYYFSDGQRFLFASEQNALRNQLDLRINEDAIHRYLRLGYFFHGETPYQQVREIPPGSWALVPFNDPTPRITKWWNIHEFYLQHSPDDMDTAVRKVDEYLHEAIRNRVQSSDLEVGSFLSGGIDSGVVTAIAKQYNQSIKTFTVSFEGEYDEAPLAKLVAERYRTVHHEIRISFNTLVNDVEAILTNYGEPFLDSSSIPSFYVSQAAKKHLTVILNGDGGDEIFGGYRRYVPFAKYDFFKPGFVIKSGASLLNTVLPVSHNKKSKYNFIYRLADFARKGGLETYLSATIDSFEGHEQWLTAPAGILDPVRMDFDVINRSKMSGLRKIMNLDFDNILSNDLLKKMDIATMTHSLEGRSPLLARRLLEYVPTLKDSFKIKGSQTKFLLRKVAEKYLPAELINQPKRGFEIPLKKWIDGELKELVADYLFSSDTYSRNFVKAPFIEKLWKREINAGDEKRAKMIWSFFALEVWYKKCYLRNA